jgi:hypothetical protein
MEIDLLREMHPRYQNHMIPSRAIIVIMGLKECRERGRREFWHDLLYFWKKEKNDHRGSQSQA